MPIVTTRNTPAAAGRTRSRRLRRAVATAAVAAAVAVAGAGLVPDADASRPPNAGPQVRAKNVIIMISDGCGYQHIAATDLYQHGRLGTQPYEHFPVRVGMSTYSFYGSYNPLQAWATFDYVKNAPTDSASAATAMSTGVKTYDAAIGVDIDKVPLRHVAERAEELGKATGVVTSVQWSHATPAGFVAHNPSRNDYAGIGAEMIGSSATDVIMGAGHPWFDGNGAPLSAASTYKYVGGESTWNALKAGVAGGDADGDGDADAFTHIETKAEFEALARAKSAPDRICGTAQAAQTLQQGRVDARGATPYGQLSYYSDDAPGAVPFNTNVPDLRTMTRGALNVLDQDDDGFFLMVEGGAIDWAGHANEKGRTIEEEIDFNRSVRAVIRWVDRHSNWGETLLIVTGDHETGYLTGPGSGQTAAGPVWTPIVSNGTRVLPGMQFNSGDHTNSLIPLFAKGSAARVLRKVATGTDPVRGAYLDNTDIAQVVFSALR